MNKKLVLFFILFICITISYSFAVPLPLYTEDGKYLSQGFEFKIPVRVIGKTGIIIRQVDMLASPGVLATIGEVAVIGGDASSVTISLSGSNSSSNNSELALYSATTKQKIPYDLSLCEGSSDGKVVLSTNDFVDGAATANTLKRGVYYYINLLEHEKAYLAADDYHGTIVVTVEETK